MKPTIIPSLIAKNQRELDSRFKKVKNHSKIFHLDVMDGKFVKNKSLMFDFKLQRREKEYTAHLMVQDPESWISKNWKKVNTIILHLESPNKGKKIRDVIKLVKSKKKKVGIAINPKTKIKDLIPHLSNINIILVMTVNPGKYGSEFLPNALKKVKQLKRLKPKLDIRLDGGINNKTINSAKKSGANSFVAGSYLQNSGDVEISMKKLRRELRG